MISELSRFLSGPTRLRRGALLRRRLAREALRCQTALRQPQSPADYRQLQRLCDAITAAQAVLETLICDEDK